MVSLEELPTAVLLEIFGWLSPSDLGLLLRVCRRFYGIVSTHGSLYRDVFLTFLVSFPPMSIAKTITQLATTSMWMWVWVWVMADACWAIGPSEQSC